MADAFDADARPDPTHDRTQALTVRGLTKAFPGTVALDDVDMVVRHGEVHALVGGNGSGKSTLIKILTGVYQADGGVITVGDTELAASAMTPDLAYSLGIRVVHQDLAVFPALTVAENMALGSGFPLTRTRRVDWRALRARTNELIERFEINAEPGDLLGAVPVATRTQIAIARALQDLEGQQGVVILDEPTAALPRHEVELLLGTVRRLAADGHAIVFVSHRLDEVLSVTDRVTILRDGRRWAEHRTADLSEAELIESILGRGLESAHAHRESTSAGPVVLTIRGLDAGPLQGVDLEVRAGETVGIAGLLGSGRSELLRAICGDLSLNSGTVEIDGRAEKFADMGEAIDAGVVMVPENRLVEGAFVELTVDENVNISVLRRYWRWFGFRSRAMRRDAAQLRADFKVKAPNGDVAMAALSGGNQQKAILARWLRRTPRLLLLDEPTQGVDVGARADIHAAVRAVVDQGGAALMVASDLEELAQVVDRAVVLRSGRIVAHVPREELTAFRLNELIYMESTR